MRRLAKAAGVPEDVLARTDPDELAAQVGGVLRLVAENLMQLLTARRQAKRLARSSSHTTVQAIDNNPLKFCPSAPDALRIMFGPATPAISMQIAPSAKASRTSKRTRSRPIPPCSMPLTMLMADLDPRAIEKDIDEDRGISGLLASRKAKLWDAYVARWQAKIAGAGGGPIEAFMLYFAEAYDRDGG